jgi:hypothetical protein
MTQLSFLVGEKKDRSTAKKEPTHRPGDKKKTKKKSFLESPKNKKTTVTKDETKSIKALAG